MGSGCGLLTACGAWLVGGSGAAVGVDVRQAAVDMGAASVQRLATSSAAYAQAAAPARFEVHNVFMPNESHKVR